MPPRSFRYIVSSQMPRHQPPDPTSLLVGFLSAIQNNAFTNTGWSHLIDGVLDFRVQPFDLNGYAMITNSSQYNAGASQIRLIPTPFFTLPECRIQRPWLLFSQQRHPRRPWKFR